MFVRRSTRPAPDLAEMRGEWRSEPTWPAERLQRQTWRPEGDGQDRIAVRGDVGTAAWISCAGKPPWTLPDDQREDDARSLTYDWAPLERRAGDPRPPATPPHGDVAASASHSCPRGSATSSRTARRRSSAAASSTSRTETGTRRRKPLEPGVPTAVELELEATSWIFEPGHRVRLALAGSDWPNTWPPPHAGTLEDRACDRSSSSCPCSTGRRSRRRPSSGRRRPEPPTRHVETWSAAGRPPIEHDTVGRQTRVVTSYGSRYDGPYEAKIEEDYDGLVGVATRTPGRAWASARTARY